jgi:hypothetical protein
MSTQRLRSSRRILFPWEDRGSVRRYFAMGRFRPVLIFLVAGSFLMWVFARERAAAGERQTRVALRAVRPAVDRYMLENEGNCPSALQEVHPYMSKQEIPLDAWGRQLRLVCPSLRAGVAYVLMSDGPDGAPGGRDRIEY